uniref:Uncharacterized protein n=1 Tax=Romanomermis culicivorax TaxID=13658 RepID=A0A915JR31_ROMCU
MLARRFLLSKLWKIIAAAVHFRRQKPTLKFWNVTLKTFGINLQRDNRYQTFILNTSRFIIGKSLKIKSPIGAIKTSSCCEGFELSVTPLVQHFRIP